MFVSLKLEDIGNGSNRCRLQDQVRRLVSLFERPYLIIEADRASRDQQRWGPSTVSRSVGPDASSVIFKPTSPYLCLTLATLTQTEVTVLHSTSQRKFTPLSLLPCSYLPFSALLSLPVNCFTSSRRSELLAAPIKHHLRNYCVASVT